MLENAGTPQPALPAPHKYVLQAAVSNFLTIYGRCRPFFAESLTRNGRLEQVSNKYKE
jgi:hypothetical protein